MAETKLQECQHNHATQFADPTPEGIANNLPAKVLEPLGTSKCLDCGALFVLEPYISPVEAARSTLAQKVLAVVREHAPILRDDESERQQVIDDVDTALRELFKREGIEVKL